MRRIVFGISLLLLQPALPAAWGWGAAVHRALTHLALDNLPADAPAWLRDPEVRARAAFLANQPDRWRGWKSAALTHANDPEHYIDIELLDSFGLTLDTVPRLRREYLRTLVIGKHEHPERIEPYDAAKDPARTQEWPGFVLHAVAESYARLQAALNQVRILEKLDDPTRRVQLAEARGVALYQIGELSHFVADMSQPLHTTKHYDGWAGDNPAGYHWRERFHAYVDAGIAEKHHLDYAALRPRVKADVKVNSDDPWNDVLAYFKRSHAQLEPLYALERDGKLDGVEGAALITERLSDAASMLSALLGAACKSSEPTTEQVEKWARYDSLDPGEAGSPPP